MNEQKKTRDTIKKQKKIILIVMASLVMFAVLYFLISAIDFDKIFNGKDQGSNNSSATIHFADESLSKYPSEDEWYMTEARREIEYIHGQGTVFYEILFSEDDAIEKGEPVRVLYDLIGYIKAGDYEGYNSCFSSHYFKSFPAQGKFTKQKIYDISITEYTSETKSSEGVTFIEYTYILQYRIRHNNGTLRKDVGSDTIKKQYVVLSERAGEGMAIDRIYTLNETVIGG